MKKEIIVEYMKKGELPIESLSSEIIEKYEIKEGDITPVTKLKIIKAD
jgi:metal-dependent HD superfamily phosphatase/phosphodiesterase